MSDTIKDRLIELFAMSAQHLAEQGVGCILIIDDEMHVAVTEDNPSGLLEFVTHLGEHGDIDEFLGCLINDARMNGHKYRSLAKLGIPCVPTGEVTLQ